MKPQSLVSTVGSVRNDLIDRQSRSEDELLEVLLPILAVIRQRILSSAEFISRKIETSPGSLNSFRLEIWVGPVFLEASVHLMAFTAYLLQHISHNQQIEIIQGQADAVRMIRAAVGVSDFPVNLNTYAAIELIQTLVNTPLQQLLHGIAPATTRDAKIALVSDILEGVDPRQAALDAVDIFDTIKARMVTIFRTEIIRAFRSSALTVYKENSGVVEGWRWTAYLDHRTCPFCIAMDGKVFPNSVSLSSHPSCRCYAVPEILSRDELGISGVQDDQPELQEGAEWFAQQSEVVQRKMLGQSKYELYSSGKLKLDDLVGFHNNPRWGMQGWERSLTDIEKGRYKPPKGFLKKTF